MAVSLELGSNYLSGISMKYTHHLQSEMDLQNLSGVGYIAVKSGARLIPGSPAAISASSPPRSFSSSSSCQSASSSSSHCGMCSTAPPPSALSPVSWPFLTASSARLSSSALLRPRKSLWHTVFEAEATRTGTRPERDFEMFEMFNSRTSEHPQMLRRL